MTALIHNGGGEEIRQAVVNRLKFETLRRPLYLGEIVDVVLSELHAIEPMPRWGVQECPQKRNRVIVTIESETPIVLDDCLSESDVLI